MTITNPDYTDAFANGGTGGLLSQVLSPWGGGGKFILVLLSLSVMCVIRAVSNAPYQCTQRNSAQTIFRTRIRQVFLCKP